MVRQAGDLAVRPRGGSRYSGTAGVKCSNCSVMQIKSGELGTAGCLAAALFEGPWGVVAEACGWRDTAGRRLRRSPNGMDPTERSVERRSEWGKRDRGARVCVVGTWVKRCSVDGRDADVVMGRSKRGVNVS
eukprot:102485-Rhodomonas_salina.1